MNTKALRQKILDLAIHGKLVPQDPNDEPASVLLERIRDEKERLIKEGKIKRPKKAKATSDKPHYENVPFEVPSSWVWTTLGEICIFLSRGKSPKYKDEDRTYPVFAQKCNLKEGGISLEQARFIDPNTIDKWAEEYKLKTGDILINSTGTGTVGRTRLFNESCLGDYPFVVPDSHVSVVRTHDEILSEFIYAYISSNFVQQYLEENLAGSTNQKELYIGVLDSLNIPLPPCKEQKRIADEIEKWSNLSYKIDIDRDNLKHTIKHVKSKILYLAIHGKLVPQDPTDEPACELLKRINPKAEITCDNGHYQKLPEGWAVCCLENVAKVLDNLPKPINSNERNSRIANKHESELFPYYGATGQVGFIDDYLVDGKFLLLGEDGAPFLDKYAIKSYPIKGKCWVNNHAHILKPLCDFDYLMYYLNHVDYKDYVKGSTRHKLTKSDKLSIKILLPPLTEQKRISVKVKYLFCLLDTIACCL